MKSIHPYPSRRSKTILVLELSPLRFRAAIAGLREGSLEMIKIVEKTGLDDAAAIESALLELGSLPWEAVMVSSLALPFHLSALPDSGQEQARREEMLRWELEPQISALIYAPGPSTLLHWQGKWKAESGDALLGATIGLSSLNATQWRKSLVSSGAVSPEELERLSAVSDTWQGIPPPAGIAGQVCGGGALVTAWSQPQVGLVTAALKTRRITLLGLLPMCGAAWTLLPEAGECRLLERMPGQFLLTSFDKNGRAVLTWHQYHADGLPDSLLRELMASPLRRLHVADDLGASPVLREALGGGVSPLEVVELPAHAAIRGAAALALGLAGPVQAPAAGLLPPPRRLGIWGWSLVTSAFFALGSCVYAWKSGQGQIRAAEAKLSTKRQEVKQRGDESKVRQDARRDAASLNQEVLSLEERLAAVKEQERLGQRVSDRSAEFTRLLLAAGSLGDGIVLSSLEADGHDLIRISGFCRDLVKVQQAAAQLNQVLSSAKQTLRFRVLTQKSGAFILESQAAEAQP
ncbi:MAG: hypothetical protein RL095_3005 [Verrucomicrobiota bacterium]|jgi:hypothetical protein